MQSVGASLPCLDSLQELLNPNNGKFIWHSLIEQDTNYLQHLIPNINVRVNITIELTKALYDKIERDEMQFKSSREIEWAIEVLGYGFIPPQYPYMREDRNYLKNILTIYEYILTEEVELIIENRKIRCATLKPALKIAEYNHQLIFCKMLSHMTLIFDKKNFEKRINIPGVIDPKLREEELKAPMKMCAFVLRIYEKFLLKSYNYLYAETWEYIIKLLIGLCTYVLEGSDAKYSDRIAVGLVELMYNAWILSGLQNDTLWNTFSSYVQRLIHRDIILSYWNDVVTELTAKMLIDLKCFPTPKILVVSEKDKIEHEQNLLVISHNYNLGRSDQQVKKKFTLFLQPFIFDISYEQTLYLWAKMINLFNSTSFINDPRIFQILMRGLRNVISLILKIGSHYKTKDEIQEYSDYNISNRRKILIKPEKRDYGHYKTLFAQIAKTGKIKPNTRRAGTTTFLRKLSEDLKIVETPSSPSNTDQDRSPRKREESKVGPFLETDFAWFVMKDKIPSGEAILKIFGKILFETAETNLPSFEEVRLIAITTLCQIFTKASGPFSEKLLKRFYQAYLEYIESDISWPHFQLFLKYNSRIFITGNLPHNIILQKSLIKKITEYYNLPKNKHTEMTSDKVLRRACNKVLTSLLCFFNDEFGLINQMYRYDKNIKEVLLNILDMTFTKDKEASIGLKSANIQTHREEVKILSRSAWNLMVFCLLNYKISSFVSKINDSFFDKNYPSVNKLMIDTFLTIGEYCLIRLEECETVSQMASDLYFSGLMIVERMNKFLEMKIKEYLEIQKQPFPINTEKEEATRLMSLALGTIYTWLIILIYLKDKESEKRKKDFNALLESTLQMLISSLQCESISICIRCIITALFNGIGRFNATKNLPFASSAILKNSDETEEYENSNKLHLYIESVVMKKVEEKCIMRLAIGEDTILSFYDFEIESPNEVITFLVRNLTGNFWWFGELFYKLIHPDSENKDSEIKKHIDFLQTSPEESAKGLKSLKSQSSLDSDTTKESSGSINQEIDVLLEKQFEMEEVYEDKYKKAKMDMTPQNTFSPEDLHSPLYKKDADCINFTKKNSVKMFLSNSGILNLRDINNISYIPTNEQSNAFLEKIDSVPDRCQILATLLYVVKPSSEKLDNFPTYDTLFQKFIDDLGNVVDEEILETGAYHSIENHIKKHEKVLYASNLLYEVIFTLPNLTQKERDLEEIAQFSSIVIIWNARTFTPHDQSFPNLINHLNLKDFKTALIITPLNDNYFLINLLKKNPDFMLFPPINDFVCSIHMLPSLIMQIVINLDREYKIHQKKQHYHEIVFSNMIARKSLISDFVKLNKSKDDFQNLLSAFFDSKTSKKQ